MYEQPDKWTDEWINAGWIVTDQCLDWQTNSLDVQFHLGASQRMLLVVIWLATAIHGYDRE